MQIPNEEVSISHREVREMAHWCGPCLTCVRPWAEFPTKMAKITNKKVSNLCTKLQRISVGPPSKTMSHREVPNHDRTKVRSEKFNFSILKKKKKKKESEGPER